MFTVTLKIITAIGAVNWGLIGLFDFNLVTYLFASYPMIERIIYVIYRLRELGFSYKKKPFPMWKLVKKKEGATEN